VGVAVGLEATDTGVTVGAEPIGPVVVLFIVHASAIQIKELSIKLKPSIFFTSDSQTFEIRQLHFSSKTVIKSVLFDTQN
jgi:hypothetical protein